MGVRGSLLKKNLRRYMNANMKMSESLEIDGRKPELLEEVRKPAGPARLAQLPG